MPKFDNLAAAMSYVKVEGNRRDIEAAKRLKRAASLPAPKVGPKVARS